MCCFDIFSLPFFDVILLWSFASVVAIVHLSGKIGFDDGISLFCADVFNGVGLIVCTDVLSYAVGSCP